MEGKVLGIDWTLELLDYLKEANNEDAPLVLAAHTALTSIVSLLSSKSPRTCLTEPPFIQFKLEGVAPCSCARWHRYSRRGWGMLLHPKLAWFTQEVPSLLITAVFCYSAGNYSPFSARTLLTGLFLAHYS
eukprot:1144087-Pelagomonas_calceolata.AAC.4